MLCARVFQDLVPNCTLPGGWIERGVVDITAPKADVIGKVEVKLRKEVNPIVDQVEVRCPHISNLVSRARKELPDAGNEMGVSMQPILGRHERLLFLI